VPETRLSALDRQRASTSRQYGLIASGFVRTFLVGGGFDAVAAHRPFVAAADGPVVAFVLDAGDTTDRDRWIRTLTAAGAPKATVVVVSAARPPRPDDLADASGVYVAGGLTPAYRDVLVGRGTGWLDAAREAGLVYGGFSAGAAIAPARALVGGWRASVGGREIAVCHEDCAEDLDPVTVLPGLGLVPFVVDVHAAQWGTLNRLVHGLAVAGAGEGWAIDEHTALDVDGDVAAVHGEGAATRVRRDDSGVQLTVHVAGDSVVFGTW
jgi:cyanophycinase